MPALPLIAWARPGQETLLREAIDVAGLTLVAVASDQRGGASELARTFDVEAVADVREAVNRLSSGVLLLAAPTALEASARKTIRECDLTTFSLEPRPGEINALLKDPDEAETARFVPLLRHAAGFREARQILHDTDPPHGLYLSCRARPEDGSLFARLLDVMDVVDHLCGDVESISATLADPERDAAAAGRTTPDSLTGLAGHMSINFGFAENRCASAVISNVSDGWFRGVTLFAGTGCLHVTDRECHWSSAPGESMHRSSGEPVSAGRLVGEAIRRGLEARDHDEAPPHLPRLLALCEAARLSTRTGQSESPSRMLAMMSRV